MFLKKIIVITIAITAILLCLLKFANIQKNKNVQQGKRLLISYAVDNGIAYNLDNVGGKEKIYKDNKKILDISGSINNFCVNGDKLIFIFVNPENMDKAQGKDCYLVKSYDMKTGKSKQLLTIKGNYSYAHAFDKVFIADNYAHKMYIIDNNENVNEVDLQVNIDSFNGFKDALFAKYYDYGSEENSFDVKVYSIDEKGNMKYVFKDKNIYDIFYNSSLGSVYYSVLENPIHIKKAGSFEEYDIKDMLIFMKEKIILISKDDNCAYLLDSDFNKIKTAFSYFKNTPSFIKYDNKTDRIYYLNENKEIVFYK